jgi:hypothetical protein
MRIWRGFGRLRCNDDGNVVRLRMVSWKDDHIQRPVEKGMRLSGEA